MSERDLSDSPKLGVVASALVTVGEKVLAVVDKTIPAPQTTAPDAYQPPAK
jgi:hypothetical protein